MTRHYPPTVIPVTHSATQVADLHRERARPVPLPAEPEPAARAAWEAAPESTPAPAPQPKASRPLKIVVERPVKPLAPGEKPDDETVAAVLDAVFGNRVPENSATRRAAAASLRRSQQRTTRRTP